MTTQGTKRSFFRNALDQLIEARSRQASRYVAGALLALDDETLKAHGYTRETLQKNARAPYMF